MSTGTKSLKVSSDGGSTTDIDSLRKLLHETAATCQKCLAAVDSRSTQHTDSSLPQHSSSPVDTDVFKRLQRQCVELESKLQLDEDNKRLRAELSKSHEISSQLTERVRSLTAELNRSSVTRSGTQPVPNCEDRMDGDGYIQLLEEQAKQFRSDFESEKRDRVAAQEKVNELESQLMMSTRQLQQLSMQTMQNIAQRREAAMQYHREQYDSDSSNYPLGSGNVSVNSSARNGPPDGFDEVDCTGPRQQNGEDCI